MPLNRPLATSVWRTVCRMLRSPGSAATRGYPARRSRACTTRVAQHVPVNRELQPARLVKRSPAHSLWRAHFTDTMARPTAYKLPFTIEDLQREFNNEISLLKGCSDLIKVNKW